MESFCEIQKNIEKWMVFGHFRLILAVFLTSQFYENDQIAHKGP